ncbi:nucleotidyltransferase family protein [Margalitia sp. FSL K6-0131]|uniref:nucleotidyltransferase family protein n=1 Tax=Margalitia sp. FSL K6-0131 TaxID=2954604 RepID=UPI0030F7A8C4
MTGIFAVILASGQSTRMGTPKLLLPWKGISIIEHILSNTFLFPFEGVKVVVPDSNVPLKRIVSTFPCDPINNHYPELGMGYSLSLAIRSLPPDAQAALILLGDQPKLHSDDIQNICESFLQKFLTKKEKSIIQMKYRDGFVGHPTLFSSHFFRELASINGDKGGKDIIRNNRRFLSHCLSEYPYPKDIDTPEDYQRLMIEGD